ncbi:MAG TPA: alpha/beta hydrolase [Actinomycetota bacterium]|nr:alpha/beta hydrolase [Actinomycetota bacterium]
MVGEGADHPDRVLQEEGVNTDGSDPWQGFERNRLALFAQHGVEGQSRRIPDHQGRTTYAVACGDGPSPTILIHGGLSDASEWALLAGRLDGPLVIPDRPGYGLTYRIDYRKLDFRRAASNWLLELVDGLGVQTVDLLGASMGGFFALAFATSHPDRVRRLVLLGAPVGLFREIPLFLRLWGNPIVGRLISRMKIPDAETLRKRAYTGLVAHPERIPVQLLEVALARGALSGTALASRTMLHAVTSLRGLRRGLWMGEDIVHLAVPTLFLWGELDGQARPSIGAEFSRRMPEAKLTTVNDAGHMPHLDQPEGVATLIRQFLGNA